MITSEKTFIKAIIADDPDFIGSEMERMDPESSIRLLQLCPKIYIINLWRSLSLSYRDLILPLLPTHILEMLLKEMDGQSIAQLVRGLSTEESNRYMQILDHYKKAEVEYILEYPVGSVGSIMDTRPISINIDTTVLSAIEIIKRHDAEYVSFLFLVNTTGELQGYITPAQLLTASRNDKLSELCKDIEMSLLPFDKIDEVAELCETQDVLVLPVVDINNRLIGSIRTKKLISLIKDDTLIDMQTMVGVSKEERSLSSPFYAVRKRQLWLQINLLTAFLASAVVGIFENTIAQVTALAVLLPIAAGQSGNAGAQAMAVSMRGLFIKEITSANWLKIALKELIAGAINGVAIAIVCMLGVYIWSADIMLALVLGFALIISMVIAGVAGALVPILLKKFGQDPAQSSSIILTTITDVTGFMSFLGIATLLLLKH